MEKEEGGDQTSRRIEANSGEEASQTGIEGWESEKLVPE